MNLSSADNFLLQLTTTSLLYFRTTRSSRSWLHSSLPVGAWLWMWMEGGQMRSDGFSCCLIVMANGGFIIIYSQLCRHHQPPYLCYFMHAMHDIYSAINIWNYLVNSLHKGFSFGAWNITYINIEQANAKIMLVWPYNKIQYQAIFKNESTVHLWCVVLIQFVIRQSWLIYDLIDYL